MKTKYTWIGGFFTAFLLLLTLAACSSSKSTEAGQANTPEAGAAESTQAPATTPGGLQLLFPTATVPATAEPYILDGAKTTDSGLQFLEVTPGNGRAPQLGDLVTMNFVGLLPDGTEFANSAASGSPVSIVYGREQLLPGWEEGLALMKAGAKAKMVLPPALAFGEEGYGAIPPHTQIILEIDLLTVEEPPQPSSVSADQLTTTDSGLKLYDLTTGKGTEVISNSIATTHFTVWVQGETKDEFVVSSLNGEPLTFVIGRGDTVFPGWEEGMLGMKVGGKRLLVIPPDLALGEQGGNGIPPNATLMMEVELVEVTEPVMMSKVSESDYKTTESGLKYYDLVVGEGESPLNGQTVVVHYTGWLEDGTIFDSSVERGAPFSFVLGAGNVIPGWDEGLAGMKAGGKRQLVIPPNLAYGEQGSGSVIPPGATLIFDVELLEIQP